MTARSHPPGSRRAKRGREVRRHALGMARVNRVRGRWPVALKAAVSLVVPLGVATALGHQEWAMTCSLGAFAVLYGPATAYRHRAVLAAAAGLGLVLAALIGAFSVHLPAAHLALAVLVAVLATFLTTALKVGPPGAVFFPLVTGVAGFVVDNGGDPWQVVLTVVVGAVTAWVVSMSGALVDPRAPEKRAVAAATRAIEAYERVDAEDEAYTAARDAASLALHTAWTTVTDATGARRARGRLDLVMQMRELHRRYALRTAFAAQRATDIFGLHSQADPGGPEQRESAKGLGDAAPEQRAAARPPEREATAQRSTVGPTTRIDLEGLRQRSLGRPSAAYLLRDALQRPSEPRTITARVAIAATLSAVVAGLFGPGHTYWAVFTAVLVLHQGGTRLAQTYRGVQRLAGTLVGVALFAALVWADPRGWWLVAVLGALQFGVEMLVVRNYGLASMLITPLALTVGWVGGGRIGAETVVVDRVVDTLLAVVLALATLWLAGRDSPLLAFRGQGRRCILAMEAVMADVAVGRADTPEGRERRRHLYFELLEYRTVGERALADAPGEVRPYLPMRREITELGYFVLGACWHPALSLDTRRFARAREGFAPILAAPVTQPRAADDIEADVRAVHRLITDWDGIDDVGDADTGEDTGKDTGGDIENGADGGKR